MAAWTGAAGHRLGEVDALRGFALLGVIAVNSMQIAGPWAWSASPTPEASVAYVARFLVTVVFATKFYLLFSFLFGYSFTLQIASAQRVGARFRPRYLRRLVGLFALGIAHAVLLYVGDILTTYAVLGLVLLGMRELRPAQALRWAATVIGVLGLSYVGLGTLIAVSQAVAPSGGAEAQAIVPVEQLVTKYRGPPSSVVAANLELLPATFSSIAIFQAPSAFAMFLLGLAAGKRGLLASWFPRTAVLRRVIGVGLLVGIPGAIVFAMSTHGVLGTPWVVVALGVDVLTAPALSAAYASALILAMRAGWGWWVRAAFAPAGQLALTNYLSQSVLLVLVFTGYGLALYDRLGGAQVFAVALGVYGLQLAVSAWWVRHLRYGPAEWVLRTLTYARIPRARR